MTSLFTLLERRGLTSKLVVGFSGVLLFALAVGAQSLVNLRLISAETQQMYEQDLLGLSHIKEANLNLIFIGRALHAMALAQNDTARKAARERIDEAAATLRKELEEARERI